MIIKQRNPQKIRDDAIRMAIKRAESGCLPCVQSYLELAKRHGATEADFRQAIDELPQSFGKGVSRRNLLKIAVGVAAGLAVGLPSLLTTSGIARAASSFWGTDTNTATCCGLPQDMYLGHLGAGTATGDTSNFNVDAANSAGYSSIYGYWDVEGPGQAPNTDPYTWGNQQGQTAATEWFGNNPNAGYIGGTTVFGDIEANNPGWSGNQSDNQAVLQGFLDGVQSVASSSASLIPGVYITPNDWQAFFGTDYAPAQNFVLWVAGCQTCTVSCRPCDACTDTPTQVDNLLPTISQISLGGSMAVVWQYWVGECGCGDFDVALQDPSAGFSPIAGPVYQCSGCGAGTGNCV